MATGTNDQKHRSADAGETPARTVLVVEPHRLVREALVAAIDSTPGLVAIDAPEPGPSARDQADAAIVAASAVGDGWTGLIDASLHGRGPWPLVLVAEHGPCQPSVDSSGIVVASPQTSLAEAVRCLRADADELGRLPVWHANGPPQHLLSVRERQVLGLLASGLSPTQSGRVLAITTNTVRDHIKSIRSKLHKPTTTAAILEAIRLGILQIEQA